MHCTMRAHVLTRVKVFLVHFLSPHILLWITEPGGKNLIGIALPVSNGTGWSREAMTLSPGRKPCGQRMYCIS